MPRNPERDRWHREEKRQRIVDAAREIFTLRGVTATKMSDIAAAAGLSHGNVYNYFGSKEELLYTMVLQGQDVYSGLLSRMQNQPGSALEKLEWLIEQFLLSSNASTTYWIVLQAQATDVLSPEARNEITAIVHANRQVIIAIIEEGQREGSIAQWDSTELATVFLTAYHNMALWPIRGFGQPQPSVTGLILKLLRPYPNQEGNGPLGRPG